MAGPTTPLLPRRALYFLSAAAVAGIGAGLLTYQLTPNAAYSIVAGSFAAGGMLRWLQSINKASLGGPHGLGSIVVAIMIGVGITVTLCVGGMPIAGAVLIGVPSAGGALIVIHEWIP